MKKMIIIALAFVFALSMVGCTEEGSLDVINGTAGWVDATIDGDVTSLEEGQSVKTTWDFDVDEELDVDVTAEGLFVFNYESTTLIFGGINDAVTISADASAIRITNELTSANLVEVYISGYDNDYWGDEQLVGDYITPGSSQDFTVTPYGYDVKVIDSDGGEWTVSYFNTTGWGWSESNVLNILTVGNKSTLWSSKDFKTAGIGTEESSVFVVKRNR